MRLTSRPWPWLGLLALLAGRDAAAATPELFESADRCIACHNFLFTPSGRDVSIGTAWRAGTMANASRDPYWQASVRRELADHPEVAAAIEEECSRCHMPMANLQANAEGGKGAVTRHLPVRQQATGVDRLAGEGVSCTVCHQILPKGLGEPESFNGHFTVEAKTPAGEREVFGPFAVQPGLSAIMKSASGFEPVQAEHLGRAELCATCHTLYTAAFEGGRVIGRLPEQVPFLEWRHSAYADAQSCQDCHMERLAEPVPIASVLGPVEKGFAPHVFPGGNSFVLRMLNRFRDELAVEALPDELEVASLRTAEFLRTRAASLEVAAKRGSSGRLEIAVTVSNLTGHKLPTAYPSRRVWLHLLVQDAGGATIFESGRLEPSGAIAGNDNDADGRRFEPHHELIEDGAAVQIYEDIMVDPRGEVTTGLSTAVRYVKDNRLVPEGFEKETAGPDFAVIGAALEDADFQGGSDVVRYRVATGGASAPFRVRAALWYQPIGFRWAHNLEGYPQAEAQRFLRYYRAMSSGSAELLVEAKTAAE